MTSDYRLIVSCRHDELYPGDVRDLISCEFATAYFSAFICLDPTDYLDEMLAAIDPDTPCGPITLSEGLLGCMQMEQQVDPEDRSGNKYTRELWNTDDEMHFRIGWEEMRTIFEFTADCHEKFCLREIVQEQELELRVSPFLGKSSSGARCKSARSDV